MLHHIVEVDPEGWKSIIKRGRASPRKDALYRLDIFSFQTLATSYS